MRLYFKTKVNLLPEKVFEGFNEQLFLKLAPPFPPVRLQRFDGCKAGDKVVLKLFFIFFSQIWESTILKQVTTKNEIYFIDRGTKLPFFLKQWQHSHIIQSNEDGGSFIIDDIEYHTPFWLLDYLMYPSMWFIFAYRKPIYRKIFKK
ncbi:MAG: hypothetical protein EAZ85_01730 [Bacteroidetes bacterium]|nr:MAG: hypothetical protein EAZ85_01730 [Bacteroidota bacterium]TAG88355.1 MAG: hypothetical protein EAZ20_08700 [Bacteroidota bacterium]